MLQIGRSLVRSQLVSVEFFIDIKSFRSHYGPGVDSASNRNEYQEYFLGGKDGRCVSLTTLPPSSAVVTKAGILIFLEPFSGPGSSVGIATNYGLDGPGSNPGGDEIFRPSSPALRSTQPPVK